LIFGQYSIFMKTLQNLTLLAGLTAGLGILQAAPAQAQVCTGNGTSTASFSLAFLTANPGLTCTVGDKTYSNFSFTGFTASDAAQNVVNMSESGVGGLQHTIGMMNTSGWTSASNTFNYTVSIASGSNVLDQWAATGSSSILGSGFNSTVAATNSAPSPNPNGAINAFSTVGSPSTFNAGTTSSAFTNTFNVTSNAFTSFDNSLTQKATPTSATPGPLPILGAAAAFGSVRKLRRFSSLLKA
jgi:hypothetical protein